MDAEQELFIALKLGIEALGYAVYDGALPPEDTPYPFVYLGEFSQTDQEQKNARTGIVYPMIHVWHNKPTERGTVSRMLFEIKTVCRRIDRTNNYAWLFRNVNGQIIADDTTKAPLLHGIVEVEGLFS